MYISDILKRENNNIDLLRLFTAFMVMLFHGPALFQNSERILSQANIIPQLTPGGVDLGYLGVAIFFFLSGLLVSNSLLTKQKVVPWAWARIMRIMPAFLVTIVAGVFIIGPAFTTLPVGDYFRSGQTWRFFFRNLFLNIEYMLPGVWEDRVYGGFNGSAWSIPFEVGCYIFLVFSFVLCRRLKVSHWVFVAIALCAVFVPKEVLPSALGIGYTIIERGDIFCFVVGTLMGIYKEKIRIDKTVVTVLLLVCVLFWRCSNIIYYLFPAATAIILLYATSLRPLVGLQLKHDISYGVYLWHWPILEILYTWLNGVNYWLFFGTSAVVVTAVAYASARLVEEPCIKLGRKLGKREIPVKENSIVIILLFIVAAVIAKICY